MTNTTQNFPAVGALAGQIIGKDTKGTLIGAAVGSLLGMGWGAYKDNQARELRAALKGTQAEVRNDGNALKKKQEMCFFP